MQTDNQINGDEGDYPTITHRRSWKPAASSVPNATSERLSGLFVQSHNMPHAIAKWFMNKGLTPESLDVFLEPRLRDLLPDPSVFQDMNKACALLGEAIIAKPIGIFGDYDVDGVVLPPYYTAFCKPLASHPIFISQTASPKAMGPISQPFNP